MKTVVPSYYKDFRCIAGDCRHTCCVGWEIGVDEDSAARFPSSRSRTTVKTTRFPTTNGGCSICKMTYSPASPKPDRGRACSNISYFEIYAENY